MECLFSYGGSRKHQYKKTFFLRRIKYECVRCRNKITEWEYKNWKHMWTERDILLRQHLKNNSKKVIL